MLLYLVYLYYDESYFNDSFTVWNREITAIIVFFFNFLSFLLSFRLENFEKKNSTPSLLAIWTTMIYECQDISPIIYDFIISEFWLECILFFLLYRVFMNLKMNRKKGNKVV